MLELILLHRAAMQLADEADLARIRGDVERARELIREAYAKEREAALRVVDKHDLEPTRSVLLRSAASLALQCDMAREAEHLVALGLSGNPPDEIADELRDLFEQANFRRHLDQRGIVLQPNEFQLSISGASVGVGIARGELFIERVADVQRIVQRTTERKLRKPYREGGTSKTTELYMSVARAASMAITFHIGSPQQLTIPGIPEANIAEAVIDEIFDCLEFLNTGDMDSLRRRIPDESYYRNFVGLSRKIAPDGKQVDQVGFASTRGTRERRVYLSRPRASVPKDDKLELAPSDLADVTIAGALKHANSIRGNIIELVDVEKRRHTLHVPTGMGDIVRSYYERDVSVLARREGGRLTLIEIDEA